MAAAFTGGDVAPGGRSALVGMLPVVPTGKERHPEGGAGDAAQHPQCPGHASRK